MFVRPAMKRLFRQKTDSVASLSRPCDFPVLHLISSCLTVSFSCGIVFSLVKRTLESEKKKTYAYVIKRKIRKKMLIYVPGWHDLRKPRKKIIFSWSVRVPKLRISHCRINTPTILKFPDKLIGKGCPTTVLLSNYSSSTELQLTRNTADCIAAPRRNSEADSAAL